MRVYREIEAFITHGIWRANTAAMNRPRSLAFRIMRIIVMVVRGFREGRFPELAMSLVYITLLSLIPLLAVMFSVLKAFGVHNRLEPLVLDIVSPLGEHGVTLTTKLLTVVDGARAGVIGAAGVLTLFLSIMSLMEKIESSFNRIWHVRRARNIVRRFSDYLSVMLLGPVLVFISLGLVASLKSHALIKWLITVEPFGYLYLMFASWISYVTISLAFAFMYMFLPNTSVRFRSALAGGIAGGVLWLWCGRIFAAFLATSSSYDVIYSGFAALILFLLWLHLGWTVILVGAEVAYYHQNPPVCPPRPGTDFVSPVAREYLCLASMRLIGGNFIGGGRPLSSGNIGSALSFPEMEVRAAMGEQARAGILHETSDDPPRYVPARPLEEIALADILDAIRSGAGHARLCRANKMDEMASVDVVACRIESGVSGSLRGLTLKDLASDDLSKLA